MNFHNRNRNQKYNKATKILALLSLVLFVNFTFSIQYVNWDYFDVSLTEIIEEEEKEVECENELLETILNNDLLISLISYQIEDEHVETCLYDEIQTPPPRLS